MLHLIWLVPLVLSFWAIVHGGTKKKMPPVTSCTSGAQMTEVVVKGDD